MVDAGGLSDRVLRQIARLGGAIAGDVAAAGPVRTPHGMRDLPPWARALCAVRWGGGTLRTDDEFEWRVWIFGAVDVEDDTYPPRAWLTVGGDEGQFFYAVDLDDPHGADPSIHRFDHDESPDGSYGGRLSDMLGGLKLVAPPAAADRFPHACAAGDLATVAAALRDRPDLGVIGDSGLAPLHLAALSRSGDVVRALLDAGADPNAVVGFDMGTPWRFLDGDRFWPGELCAGATATHLLLDVEAPRRRDGYPPVLAIVRMLAAAGADPHATDSLGRTPLHLECWGPGGGRAQFTSGTAILDLLLAAGADPNLDSRRDTPLVRMASGYRDIDVEVVRLLLAAGADPNLAGAGSSPLAEAAYHGSPATVELLLAAGADPGRPTGMTQHGVAGVTAPRSFQAACRRCSRARRTSTCERSAVSRPCTSRSRRPRTPTVPRRSPCSSRPAPT